MTPVDRALALFLEAIPARKLNVESVALSSALSRVLAEDILPEEDLPRFDKSAVDGYAAAARETIGASQFRPKKFALAHRCRVDHRQVRQVWTGNQMPEGADAVAMLENVKRTKEQIEISVALTPGENVSKKGEDVPKGKKALEVGSRLGPYHLALIGALGKTKTNVYRKPVIGVIATGSELVEIGRELRSSQVYDTNRLMISSMCLELGAEPLDLGIVGDETKEICSRLKRALGTADAVITTGGTSVGEADIVPEAVNGIGKPGIVVHGVAARPGMPTALGVINKKPVIVLSGNPVAAVVGFEFFARPVICRLLGLKKTEQRPLAKARLTKKVTSALGRRTFVRVRVYMDNDEMLAEPVSARGSGAISTMTEANGYTVVTESQEGLEQGETVPVSLFGNVAEVGTGV